MDSASMVRRTAPGHYPQNSLTVPPENVVGLLNVELTTMAC